MGELGLSSSGPLSGGGGSKNFEDNSLEELYKEVVAASSSCQIVVIDNLSILHCLGHTPAAVFAFLHNLRLHLKSLGIALVVRLTQLPSDIDWMRMSKLVTLRAGLTIQVEPLATGQSREVSGSLLIRETEGVKRKFHFQVEDRGVKVFPPGTSRAVL